LWNFNVNCFAVRDEKDLANIMMDIKDPNRRMKELLEEIQVFSNVSPEQVALL